MVIVISLSGTLFNLCFLVYKHEPLIANDIWGNFGPVLNIIPFIDLSLDYPWFYAWLFKSFYSLNM